MERAKLFFIGLSWASALIEGRYKDSIPRAAKARL
jgi:hypothetical protein